MSANVETMFSVREVPWHGIGTIVREALNSQEALSAAGLDWKVLSKPIFDESGNEIEGFKSNVRSSDNSILGIVSDRYKIVQNEEAFSFTDNLIGGVTHMRLQGLSETENRSGFSVKLPLNKFLVIG